MDDRLSEGGRTGCAAVGGRPDVPIVWLLPVSEAPTAITAALSPARTGVMTSFANSSHTCIYQQRIYTGLRSQKQQNVHRFKVISLTDSAVNLQYSDH